MPKKKSYKSKSINSTLKMDVKENSVTHAPKWYILTSFSLSVLLLFIFFVDYLSTSLFISISIGLIMLVWFVINIFMLSLFVKKRVEPKALAISGIFFVYLSLLLVDSLISGISVGKVDALSDSWSNLIEFCSIIFILILSLATLQKRDYR